MERGERYTKVEPQLEATMEENSSFFYVVVCDLGSSASLHNNCSPAMNIDESSFFFLRQKSHFLQRRLSKPKGQLTYVQVFPQKEILMEDEKRDKNRKFIVVFSFQKTNNTDTKAQEPLKAKEHNGTSSFYLVSAFFWQFAVCVPRRVPIFVRRMDPNLLLLQHKVVIAHF